MHSEMLLHSVKADVHKKQEQIQDPSVKTSAARN